MSKIDHPEKRVPIDLPDVPVDMPPDKYGMSDEEFAEHLRSLAPLVMSGELSDENSFDLADLSEEELAEYYAEIHEDQIMNGEIPFTGTSTLVYPIIDDSHRGTDDRGKSQKYYDGKLLRRRSSRVAR